MKLRLHTDSSGAKSIANRVGCGRLRHMEARGLWLQQQVKGKELEVWKVAGQNNVADLGTKPLKKKRFIELLNIIDMRDKNNDFNKVV